MGDIVFGSVVRRVGYQDEDKLYVFLGHIVPAPEYPRTYIVPIASSHFLLSERIESALIKKVNYSFLPDELCGIVCNRVRKFTGTVQVEIFYREYQVIGRIEPPELEELREMVVGSYFIDQRLQDELRN